MFKPINNRLLFLFVQAFKTTGCPCVGIYLMGTQSMFCYTSHDTSLNHCVVIIKCIYDVPQAAITFVDNADHKNPKSKTQERSEVPKP